MLSDNIRNYRKENNLSQDELAEKLGVSRQSISLWENGQTQPTIDNIIALAKIFNITADELLESYDGARTFQEAPVAPKQRNGVLIAVISVITAAAVIGAGSFLLFLKNRNAENKTTSKAQGNSSSQASAPAAVEHPQKPSPRRLQPHPLQAKARVTAASLLRRRRLHPKQPLKLQRKSLIYLHIAKILQLK